jgi:predicted DNA-binding ribbon-helix-helix protein
MIRARSEAITLPRRPRTDRAPHGASTSDHCTDLCGPQPTGFYDIAGTQVSPGVVSVTLTGEKMAKGNVRTYNKQKARQASQVSKIHNALVVAGFDTVAKQAAVLGLSRSVAWAFLHHDKRAGPSNMLVKRILLSKIPWAVRAAIHQYIVDKGLGLYGHSDSALRDHRRSFAVISHSASPDALNEAELGDMNSLVVKRSVVIGEHKTSISLEEPFWAALKQIAHAQHITLSALIAQIDATREQSNLSSAIRVYVLRHPRMADKQMDVAKACLSTFGAERRPPS